MSCSNDRACVHHIISEYLVIAGKVVCASCGGKCSGEVLRVSDKYFHTACFTCRTCSASLARGGFFCKDGHYYCPQDYQRAFGTRCAACGQYVEGEVVSALGNTYHQKCFTCARCKSVLSSSTSTCIKFNRAANKQTWQLGKQSAPIMDTPGITSALLAFCGFENTKRTLLRVSRY